MSQAQPFFVAPHPAAPEGVDFLGLRTLNFTMMDQLLPGINNLVALIRPFTLMAWAAWRFDQATSGQLTSDAFKKFREKVETVYAFSQVQAGDAVGLPGRQQKTPASEVLEFSFKSFGNRTQSIIDPALYGPSIKSQNGLGFLAAHPLANNLLKVTPAGEQLALALDASLRRHLRPEQYAFIGSLEMTTAPRALIDENFPRAWGLSDVTAQERKAFRGRLYQPATIGKATPEARRSTVIAAVLATLDAAKQPLTAAQVRKSLAYTYPGSLKDHPQRETFEQMRRFWQLLQVRQAQRLALEALFGWVERELWEAPTSVAQLAASACADLGVEPGTPGDRSFLAERMQELRNAGSDIDSLFATGQRDPENLDIFAACDRLEYLFKRSSKAKTKDILSHSVRVLLLAARYGEAFKANDITKVNVSAGPRFRLPLGSWTSFVQRHESVPLSEVFAKVFGTFIISQHLGVQAARTGQDQSRLLRISIEDGGFTSTLPSPSKALSPYRTPERLASAMALMAQCGLLQALPALDGEKQIRYALADARHVAG
jgi:hypothetical protein